MSEKEMKKRRRTEIEFIEDTGKRLVTFSKRRTGLFSKAKDLSVLTGAQIAVLVLSGSGKPYSFGSPGVDTVIDRYLSSPAPEKEWWDVPMEGMGLEELRRYREFLEDLRSNLITKQLQKCEHTLLLDQRPDEKPKQEPVLDDHDQTVMSSLAEEYMSSSFSFPCDQRVSLDDIFHDQVGDYSPAFTFPVTSNFTEAAGTSGANSFDNLEFPFF